MYTHSLYNYVRSRNVCVCVRMHFRGIGSHMTTRTFDEKFLHHTAKYIISFMELFGGVDIYI